MTTTKTKLSEQYTAFLEEASEEELHVMKRMLDGWSGKRNGQYNSFIESWIQPKRGWRDDNIYETVVPIHKGMENQLGITHGGVTATLLDTTMGEMTNDTLPEGKVSVTLELKINYIKPGLGNELRCEASFLSESKRVKVTEAKVYNNHDELIAHATGTFYVISAR